MASPETRPAGPSWHSLPATDALSRLEADPHGLSATEAERRRARYGANSLPEPPRRSAFMRLLSQCNNVLIWVLLAAAAVTALLGEWTDTAVILGVVAINAIIGFVQEGKAENALEAIGRLLSPQAIALRDGHKGILPAAELVPGDIVMLQPGDLVPADLRVLEERNLHIEEAILTGESIPVSKHPAPVSEKAQMGDRASMAWSGTIVTAGTGTGVVVATGSETAIGRISTLLATVQSLATPLTRQLERFGKVLSAVIGVVSVLTMVLGVLVHGYALDEMFLAAVGLAVAAIPEGLPAIITITLAIGVQRMARRNAIIRQLPAVETLGSVSVICTDKTGTLTRNEMMVSSVVLPERSYQVSGTGFDTHGAFSLAGQEPDPAADAALQLLCHAALLCNDAEVVTGDDGPALQGDPTETALVMLAIKAGLDPRAVRARMLRDDVIPFESEQRYMATLHHDHAGACFIFAKGAPEQLLPMCASVRHANTEQPLDLAAWLERAEALAASGLRVLALAARELPGAECSTRLDQSELVKRLSLLGLVGMIDPPREEAIVAVRRCRDAGIEVKMITGDHLATARAVAASMGIGVGRGAMLGSELAAMDDEALGRIVLNTDVFARASPEHKLRLVEAMQAQQRVVAMTGDGVNDAPALKRADIGVAMGRGGTEVARRAAEMVLSDDNFASIEHAVEEGRTVYDNIRKGILFIMPTSVAEALMILLAVVMGLALPITPVQILWVNMITAVTLSIALAFEPAEKDIMQRAPRRPDEPLLGAFVAWRIGFVCAIVVAGTFGLFVQARAAGYELETARTLAVNTLVMFEAFYLINVRHIYLPTLNVQGVLGNRIAVAGILAVFSFELLLTYLPLMNRLFGTAPLALQDWLMVLLVAFMVVPLVELEKILLRRRGAVA